MKKAYEAAVIIMPPKDQWDQIQAVRKVYDKAFVRWMPHINLLYPFVDEQSFIESNLKQKLTTALCALQPFDITLDDFDFFEHSPKNCTLYLHSPSHCEEIRAIQNVLVSVVPTCNDLNIRSDDNLFHPHLTLGQFKGKNATNSKIRTLRTSWKPITWHLDRVYIIRRSRLTPFEIVDEIELGGAELLHQPDMVDIEQRLQAISVTDEKIHPNDAAVKIIEWMKRLKEQGQNLPTTKQNLSRAITKMCYINSNINWKRVRLELENLQFIRLEGTKTRVQTKELSAVNLQNYDAYTNNKQLMSNSGYSYYSSCSSQESSELSLPSSQEQQKMGLDRAVHWISSLPNTSLPTTAFDSQLQQLCNFKVYLSSDSIINYLQNLGLLQLKDDYETINYLV